MKKFAGIFFTASFRRMKKILAVLLGLTLAVFTTSCEVDLGGDSSDGGSEEGVSSNGEDDLNISNAQSFGTHKNVFAQNAGITRKLHSADQSGGFVFLSFDPLNWPSQGRVDGRVFLFWEENGQVVGGMFDWHAKGQTAKTLENVYHGYLGGKRPPKGATVYFCLTNINATERTNVKKSNNVW